VRVRTGATIFLLGLAGCASSGFQDNVYRDAHVCYRVGPLDASWHRFNVSDCNVAFRHVDGGSILANGRCSGIKDVPLDVLTNQAVIGLEDKQEHSREVITLDGRAALRTRMSATLDGVPVELDLVVLKKDNCTYDLQLVAGQKVFAERESDFWRFVEGFQQMPLGN
jgi:hypothetical protein